MFPALLKSASGECAFLSVKQKFASAFTHTHRHTHTHHTHRVFVKFSLVSVLFLWTFMFIDLYLCPK